MYAKYIYYVWEKKQLSEEEEKFFEKYGINKDSPISSIEARSKVLLPFTLA